MPCPNCGHQLAATAAFCPNCGQAVPSVPSNAATATENAEIDLKAVMSMVLGVLSIVLSVFVGIPAVILGHLSKASIRRSNGRLKGDGMALAGLILGYISLFLLPVIAGVVFVAVPNVFRTKIVTNETTTVSTLKSIYSLAENYKVENQEYPASLQELSSTGLVALDNQLAATGVQSGYQFRYKPTSGQRGYVIHADPIFIHTGQQHFFMDQTGVIRSAKDRIAGAGSEPIAPSAE
jgi:competence protein ComGC